MFSFPLEVCSPLLLRLLNSGARDVCVFKESSLDLSNRDRELNLNLWRLMESSIRLLLLLSVRVDEEGVVKLSADVSSSSYSLIERDGGALLSRCLMSLDTRRDSIGGRSWMDCQKVFA